MFAWDDWSLETQAVRAGQIRTNEGEQSEPIFPTSSFTFASAAEAAARFSGESPGNIYSRFTNPTVRVFEQRLAAMEGGEQCVATSSGMAAILATCMGLLQQGDHLVASRSIFGTTVVLFSQFMAKFGVTTTFVDLTDMQQWQDAIQPNTKLFFLETPANPTTDVADIQLLANLAHDHDIILAVDNCLCTPALQRPLDMGADVIIHSATKYIDGQGRALGGAVIGSAALMTNVYGFLRTAGPTMSPFNAWVFLKGLETLSLRMERHSSNALHLARWLQQQPQVESVNYPGLESHPQFALAQRQQKLPGGLLSFVVKGGKEAAWRLIDATKICSITANLGDSKTTITHPATTTHGRLTDEQKQAAGIADGLVRISAGLESVDDLQQDLQRGLVG